MMYVQSVGLQYGSEFSRCSSDGEACVSAVVSKAWLAFLDNEL